MPITREIIRKFKKSHACFIETGTYDGDTAMWAIEEGFSSVFTIEVSEERYLLAMKRFVKHPNVHVLKGHSPVVLSYLLSELVEPAFFWLDAHPDWGDTPLIDELQVIGNHQIKDHTILIDDMRNMGLSLFNTTKQRIYDAVIEINPAYKIIPIDDVCAPEDILAAIIEGESHE
jgi:hypothetical protein